MYPEDQLMYGKQSVTHDHIPKTLSLPQSSLFDCRSCSLVKWLHTSLLLRLSRSASPSSTYVALFRSQIHSPLLEVSTFRYGESLCMNHASSMSSRRITRRTFCKHVHV